MKCWMTIVTISIVGLAIFTSGCSQGISTDEYQKVINELYQAQSNAANLQNENAGLKKQITDLQQKESALNQQISSLKTENDNLKTEVTKLKQASTSTPTTPTTLAPVPTTSVTVVTADQIAADYESNPLAADIKYKNQILTVTGRILSIGSSTTQPYITFEGGGLFTTTNVKATFKSQYVANITLISKGQTITVRGLFIGKGFLYTEMVDCDLVP